MADQLPTARPTYAQLSVMINKLITERDGEWCGMPMPLPGLGLVLEDRHPGAARLAQIQAIIDGGAKEKAADPDIAGWQVVNRWHGRSPKSDIVGDVVIMRHEDGRFQWGIDPDAPRRNRFLFGPFETMDAWNLDTECTAIDKLAGLLSERMFKAYVLTGGFIETSPRSGISYLFRRLRPTIAMTPHGDRHDYFYGDDPADDGHRQMTILACLCLHPLAYYAQTFCGAMTPTDDIMAHLLLMRGDEAMFWRRANQHHPLSPESGL